MVKLNDIPELRGANLFQEKILLLCKTVNTNEALYYNGNKQWIGNFDLFGECKTSKECPYVLTE